MSTGKAPTPNIYPNIYPQFLHLSGSFEGMLYEKGSCQQLGQASALCLLQLWDPNVGSASRKRS